MKNEWRSLGTVCAVVIGVYVYTAHWGFWGSTSLNAADNYYNLLVQGFRAGQLSLKKEVPPGFAQLADPYDPTAGEPYQLGPARLHDLSYYKGRLFLYFGVTPALILFWPYVAVTGHYIAHRQAVVIFSVLGFVASMGLLRAVWRRYFAEVNVWVVAACVLALGLATAVPAILPRSAYNEVAISCGYMLTMLTLWAIWRALHEPEMQCRWLAAASLAYGLAVGARPSLLFGAVILLVPVAQAWRERRPIGALLISATGPIAVIGVGLMLYNFLRFGNPFEFGQQYQLAGVRSVGRHYFLLRFVWFNLRVYFWEPARWSARFPWVHDIGVRSVPAGYDTVENPFGVLTNIPFVWLALAAPLAWRNRWGSEGSMLRYFVLAVSLLIGASVLILLFYDYATIRYEVDFLPALVLLAVVGILGLERALADRPVWRCAARWGWGALLSFSVAFNLLVSFERCVDLYAGAYFTAGVSMRQLGKMPEAMELFQQALRIKPDYAEAHNNLGNVLTRSGRIPDAIEHLEQALRIKPDFAEAHYNLGNALARSGRMPEAIEHLEQALRIKPDYAEAHYNLGIALARVGKSEDAIRHYEQALRIKPDYAEAHCSLGAALGQSGRIPDAIEHLAQALRIKPDYAEAHCNLGIALARSGRMMEAIGHWEQALRIEPEYAEAHYNLGTALEKAGRIPEAVGHLEQALRIKPDFIQAQNALARLQARQ